MGDHFFSKLRSLRRTSLALHATVTRRQIREFQFLCRVINSDTCPSTDAFLPIPHTTGDSTKKSPGTYLFNCDESVYVLGMMMHDASKLIKSGRNIRIDRTVVWSEIALLSAAACLDHPPFLARDWRDRLEGSQICNRT